MIAPLGSDTWNSSGNPSQLLQFSHTLVGGPCQGCVGHWGSQDFTIEKMTYINKYETQTRPQRVRNSIFKDLSFCQYIPVYKTPFSTIWAPAVEVVGIVTVIIVERPVEVRVWFCICSKPALFLPLQI